MQTSADINGSNPGIRLKLTWPRMASLTHREDFYLGGWHPGKHLTVEWTAPPPTIQPAVIHAANWFLLSNRSLLHPHQPGLIHAAEPSGTSSAAVAFRGYLIEPPIHSYSSSDEILKYWQAPRFPTEQNGVFSAACLRDSGRTLTLTTDALGMAPLYYRWLGEVLLFATNPRYLTADDDEPDYLAWRSQLQAGLIVADRTLSTLIKRVPAGCRLRFTPDRVEREQWFDYRTLPNGTQAIDAAAIAQVEGAFQVALSRCLRLKAAGYFLALSSGFDSRRILAGLIRRNEPFASATVGSFEKGYYNLDGRFAALMAKDLGFTHQKIAPRTPLEYAYDDYQRRILLHGESQEHTWALALMRALPQYPTILFEGLGGDALGETGFDTIPGLHVSPETDRQLITQHLISDAYEPILHPQRWPRATILRNELNACIEALPTGMNQAELAFLLLRTRRSTALWAQQMLPVGHVVVCPYLDLDYIRTVLRYHPRDKLRESFQISCLKRYWPRYFAYPGSRAIPAELRPDSPQLKNRRELACFQQYKQELRENKKLPQLLDLLGKRASLRLLIALQNNFVALRSFWAFRPLMELVAQHPVRIACWQVLPPESRTP